MYKFCYICQGKISLMEDHRFVNGLFIHRVTLSPNGERRYCYDEYKRHRNKESDVDSMRMAGL